MSKFYIGQKVVAIRDHSQGVFKKGDEFTVLDLKQCCNYNLIKVNANNYMGITKCNCGFVFNDEFYYDICFAPIELSETTFEEVIKQINPKTVLN